MIHQLGRFVKETKVSEVTLSNGENKKVFNNTLALRVDKETSAFIDVTAWGNIAENLAKHFKKGNEVLLSGEIRNKKSKVGEKEITNVFILITGYEFTNGNKKDEE